MHDIGAGRRSTFRGPCMRHRARFSTIGGEDFTWSGSDIDRPRAEQMEFYKSWDVLRGKVTLGRPWTYLVRVDSSSSTEDGKEGGGRGGCWWSRERSAGSYLQEPLRKKMFRYHHVIGGHDMH